uniref:Uncharacterized protein n=1 Tax=Globodera rostochiensis TaxID=31243 RepID=A0A914HJW7_GLORO
MRNMPIFACQSSQLQPPIPAVPMQDPQIALYGEKLFASVKAQTEKRYKEEDRVVNDTMEMIAASSFTTTMVPSSFAPPKISCNTAYVVAVTIQSYNEQTLQADYLALITKLNILETFLRVKLASFGEYAILPINEGGNFALKIFYDNVTADCGAMRDFAAKTVSYSKEVEKAIFSCKCGGPGCDKLPTACETGTKCVTSRPATLNRNVLKHNSFESELTSLIRKHPNKSGKTRGKENSIIPNADKENVARLEKKGLIVDILPKGDGDRVAVINELKNIKLKPTTPIT